MSAASSSTLLHRAITAHRAGHWDQAADAYARVRRTVPRNFDAWHLGGLVELQRGRAATAAELLTRARTLNPRDAWCATRLGVALLALERPTEAREALEAAARIPSAPAETWLHLGAARAATGDSHGADAAWTEALRQRPDYAEVHDRRGTLALPVDPAGAVAHFRAAAAARPDWAQAWCNLGLALTSVGDAGAAHAALDRAVTLDPRLAKIHTARGLLLQQTYRPREAVEAFGAALALTPHDAEARSGRLLTLHYLDDVDADTLGREHTAGGNALAAASGTPWPEPGLTRRPESARRLRLAFLSPDLRRHSVAWFLLPLLEHLDRDVFEVWLYHDHAIEDDVSAALRAHADRWSNVHTATHAALLQRLREDAPDILVDLAGHTGQNRQPVLARRAARLQVAYLGYPDTTGLPTMDVRLVDATTDPSPTADARARERLVRFAPTAWSYRAPADAPSVAPPPSVTGGAVTFGSFNNYAKVSDATVALWSVLLHELPDSRLLLKSAGLEQSDLAAAARARFAVHGITAGRLDLRGRTAAIESHLALYAAIDIALDPLPYHGTTTTCEALWMGRPVITLGGDRHANRVGASLLGAVGHPEWIATNADDYVEIAVQLATDPTRLNAIARGLRDDLQASPLLDHAGQARRFGQALQDCWTAQHHSATA